MHAASNQGSVTIGMYACAETTETNRPKGP